MLMMTPITGKKRRAVADKENMMILSNSQHKQPTIVTKVGLKLRNDIAAKNEQVSSVSIFHQVMSETPLRVRNQ